jgi:hypothetical protein
MQHTPSFKILKVKFFKSSSLYYMFRPASALATPQKAQQVPKSTLMHLMMAEAGRNM